MKFAKILFVSVLLVSLCVTVNAQEKKAWVVTDKYTKMKNTQKASPENLKIGKELFGKHCKHCHGVKGLGDGAKAPQLKTNCGDFSTAKFQAESDGVIYFQSFVGRDEMPNFEKKITAEDERWAVVNYIRSLKK